MKFRDWIKNKGLRHKAVAEWLGVSEQYLSGVLRWEDDGTGREGIPDDLKDRIVALTDGEVTLAELAWPHGRKGYPSYDALTRAQEGCRCGCES